MTIMKVNDYNKIADVVDWIVNERARNQSTMKLAFVFEGGGAKGAYQSGVLEGIAQLLKAQNKSFVDIRPDIIASTSVGSIVAFALWLEIMYPGASMSPYQLRQSALWRTLANGNGGSIKPNQAAEQLLTPGVLIDYYTGQKPIPLISEFFKAVQQLQSDGDRVKTSWGILKSSLGTVATDGINVFDDNTGNLVDGMLNNILSVVTSLGTNPLHPIDALANSDPIKNINKIGADLVSVKNALSNLANSSLDVVSDFITELGNITLQIEKLAATVAQLFEARQLGAVPVRLNGDPDVATILNSTNTLADHLLNPAGLKNTIRNFMTTSPMPTPAGLHLRAGSDSLIRSDWVARANASSGVRPPELYMTGADITNSRLLVYAMAPATSIAKIGDDETWVMDLAGSTRASTRQVNGHAVAPQNVFYPMPTQAETLLDSVMSSSALPVAFPPIHWTFTQDVSVWSRLPNAQMDTFNHTVVDGGVLDGTPYDIAVNAGATHIVSFELEPVLNYISNPDRKPTGNFVDVYTDSFNALMTRSTNRMITGICKANANPSKPPVQVFRIGPLDQYFTFTKRPANLAANIPQVVTGKIVPPFDTFNFNGLWTPDGVLIINLEDRFMQGYQDACLLSPPANAPGMLKSLPANVHNIISQELNAPGALAAQSDPVFGDYLTRALSAQTNPTGGAPTGRVCWVTANKAYLAVTQAFPAAPIPI